MRKILLFLLLCAGAFALEWDGAVLRGALPNGLKYYILENSVPKNSAVFYLVVDAGSIDESPNERGLVHFIEHMSFNGSRDFSKNELIKKLQSLGVKFGADVNAQTGYDSTIYTLSIAVSEENLKDVFKIFASIADGVEFNPLELVKERGVIIEEARSRDTPIARLYERMDEELYGGSAYFNRAPIGDMAVVKSVSAQRIKELYQKIYQPRSMKFIAVGDFKRDKILKLLKQNFSPLKNTNSYARQDMGIPSRQGLKIYNYDTNETSLNSVKISFWEEFAPPSSEANARKILKSELISSLISTIYERAKASEGALLRVNFSRSNLQFQKTIYSFDVAVLGGDFDGAISQALGLIKGLRDSGFDARDFALAKDALISSRHSAFKRRKSANSAFFAREILHAVKSGAVLPSAVKQRDLEVKLLREISLEELNLEFRRLTDLSEVHASVFSGSGYNLDEAKFKKLQSGAKAVNTHAAHKKLPDSLVSKNLPEGKILSKSLDSQFKFYTYLLENNATVILKPLKTRKDFISFAAVSRGGMSNLAHPGLGSFAAMLSNESGAGEFNNYEISQILSGRQVNYRKNISAFSHGFYGSCGSRDLKWLLEAINLELSSPRVDEKALQNLKIKSLDELARNEKLPGYKFSREFSEFFYGGNARMRPLSAAQIKALNAEELKKIIYDKFSNAASYTFVLSGDFELKDAEALIKKYLASLPVRGEREDFKDDGIRSLSGRHVFMRNYQNSPRSDVALTAINRSAPHSLENTIKISALASVLQEALRERIREDEGRTYGFSVASSLSRIPYEHSSLHISFSCAPQNTDQILSAIREIFAEIAGGGSDVARHLENFKKSQIITARTARESPEFWNDALVKYALWNEEIADFKTFEKIINSISPKDIAEAAQTYIFDTDETVRINAPKF
ncbi:M16 family metallopeptidase [Campylobacter gracilis]|uniref:Peptidase M16 inactive domain protein n=1 Tax=Campylobacter gracilis RM3268 TaxID=553220 RepID=C8PKD6_9BACT|nr:insulinase family protein [Campylobacter gracilis]AKT93494.1 zinc-dependent peptidase, M16 family [Campylobacter gracilis]EEV16545.1 peptidase M16 inactive domain protein [Campylobacter gracilis RM3268]UEB46399.1 insulinase family protein [Campylobacter gracilis]SUW78176.1 M16 family peptidase [Campylobacter gracilis]